MALQKQLEQSTNVKTVNITLVSIFRENNYEKNLVAVEKLAPIYYDDYCFLKYGQGILNCKENKWCRFIRGTAKCFMGVIRKGQL